MGLWSGRPDVFLEGKEDCLACFVVVVVVGWLSFIRIWLVGCEWVVVFGEMCIHVQERVDTPTSHTHTRTHDGSNQATQHNTRRNGLVGGGGCEPSDGARVGTHAAGKNKQHTTQEKHIYAHKREKEQVNFYRFGLGEGEPSDGAGGGQRG